MKTIIFFCALLIGIPAFASKPTKSAEVKTDPLPLKKVDLFEQNDLGWAPEVDANPENYMEEMELPERSASLEDESTTLTQ